jgi:ApeA N-terminal domain 1
MTTLEYSGWWWLPEKSDAKIPGILRIVASEMPTLTLMGGLYDSLAWPDPVAPPVILGLSTSGRPITLYKCLRVKYSLTSRTVDGVDLRTSTFRAHFAIDGCHFGTPEAILFDSMAMSFHHLPYWTRLTGLRANADLVDGRLRFNASYQQPDSPTARVDDWTIRIDFEFADDSNVLENISYRQHSSVVVVPDSPRHLEWFLNDVFFHIRNLLSLGADTPIHADALTATEVGASTKPADVTVYYSTLQSQEGAESFDFSRMLFSLSDLGTGFERAVQAWFKSTHLIRPVFELYFGTLFAPGLYLETKFLNLAQAVEAYHRRRFPGTPMARDDFSDKVRPELKRAIGATLVGDDGATKKIRELFMSKLQFFNEYSLKMRIDSLLDAHKELAAAFIDDSEQFARLVRDTRNYLTHYDEELEDKRPAPDELFDLTAQLGFLLQLCFLAELDIPIETRRAIVERNSSMAWFRQRQQRKLA